MPYQHLTHRCFIAIPFHRLRQELDTVLARGIQPEIGLEGDALSRFSVDEFREVADALAGAGLGCTLHAPFFDLAPGALDSEILAASRNKLRRAFALIPLFKPRSVVCHLGYEENKQGYRREQWFAAALATWRELLSLAEAGGACLMLENTYETDPSQHERMFVALDSQAAGLCLDVGHLMAFAKSPWQDWLPRMAPWLGQLHLHDNHGGRDEHLAPGRGSFDFPGFLNYLTKQRLSPIITLEPHSEEDLQASLEFFDRIDFL